MDKEESPEDKKTEPSPEEIMEQEFSSAAWQLMLYLIKTDPDLNENMPKDRKNSLFEKLCKSLRKDYCDGWAFLRINEMRRKPRASAKN